MKRSFHNRKHVGAAALLLCVGTMTGAAALAQDRVGHESAPTDPKSGRIFIDSAKSADDDIHHHDFEAVSPRHPNIK